MSSPKMTRMFGFLPAGAAAGEVFCCARAAEPMSASPRTSVMICLVNLIGSFSFGLPAVSPRPREFRDGERWRLRPVWGAAAEADYGTLVVRGDRTGGGAVSRGDRKSTRLNSSHVSES